MPSLHVDLLARLQPIRRVESVRPRDRHVAEAEVEDRAHVVRDAEVAFPPVRLRHAHGEDRPTAERRRSVGGDRSGDPAVTEERPGSHDPGADRADDDVESLRRAPGERRRRRDGLYVAVRAGRRCDGHLEQAGALQRPYRVRERDRQRASAELDVRDASAPSQAGPDGRQLAVEGAADDGHAAQGLRQGSVLLDMPRRRLDRRVRKRHHVGAVLPGGVEPARQVCVEDVEASRAELELPGLDVDDDLVADLDRPGQARVRDRRLPVDLEPGQVVVLLADAGDRAAPETKHATRPGMTRQAAQH
jgi:hypothetical protein